MKRHLQTSSIIMSVLLSLSSCNNAKEPTSSTSTPEASTSDSNEDQSTIEGTIRLYLDYRFSEDNGKPIIYDKMYFYKQHRDEIRKTVEVVEKDSIPGKDFLLVFYRYSVGADVAHSTSYMKKIDNKWFIHSAYYSSFDEDPFENGRGAEAKEMLKKADEWGKGDDKLWWK